jgi:hypothetical protein
VTRSARSARRALSGAAALLLALVLGVGSAGRCLAQDQDADLAAAAAARLADLQQGGEPDPGVGALANAVRTSPLPRRRVRALRLLVEIAREAELPTSEADEARRGRYVARVRNLVVTALADSEPRVRWAALGAARALAQRGREGVDAFVRSRLLPRLREDDDARIRLAVLELGFELASDAALAELLAQTAAADPNAALRARARELHPAP